MKIDCLHCQHSILLPQAEGQTFSRCICRVSGEESLILYSCSGAVANATGRLTFLGGEYFLSEREMRTERALHDKAASEGLAAYVRQIHFMQNSEYSPNALDAQYYKAARLYWRELDDMEVKNSVVTTR